MEIPKPLALQPDKAQRQLGQQNCVWLSSEDSAGSEKEAAVQAWTKVTSHRTCRSCASFGVGLFFFPFSPPSLLRQQNHSYMLLEKDEVVQEAQATMYWGHINSFVSTLTG